MVESTSTSAAPSGAQTAKEEVIEKGREVASTATEHAGAVKEEAKSKAVDVAHDVRRELQTQGDEQAKRLASVLHDVGGQLRGMADSGQPGAVTDVTRQVGDKSRQLATRLENDGMRGVGDDLATFARQKPGLFLAAAGAAGFVVARILRTASSAGSRPEPMPPSNPQLVPPAPLSSTGTSAATDTPLASPR